MNQIIAWTEDICRAFFSNPKEVEEREETKHDFQPINNKDLRADVYETDDWYVIEVETAGVPNPYIRVDQNEKMISVSAERPKQQEEKRVYHLQERQLRNIHRTFCLPDVCDITQKTMVHENGLLRIQVMKRDAEKLKGD